MRKRSYVIGVSGVVGSLMLRADLFGLAELISSHWPMFVAFLPWVGIVFSVGFGTWLVLAVIIDGRRYCVRKVARSRKRAVRLMENVANNIEWYIDTGESSFAKHDERTWQSERKKTEVRLDICELEKMGLMPHPTDERTRHNDIANHLFRMIPTVEREGIRTAKKMTQVMDAVWNGDYSSQKGTTN